MPEREELAALCEEGHTQQEIADRYGVGSKIARKWLGHYGLETQLTTQRKKPVRGEYHKTVKPKKYAPYFGVMGCPCKFECEDECRELGNLGGWMLCERPSKKDVKWAERVGLIGRYL